jgi:hypothetical protein
MRPTPTVRGKKCGSAAVRSPMSMRAANKSNDDESAAGVSPNNCKLGRMTLPACALVHAGWT